MSDKINDIKRVLKELGADKVGFGNLEKLPNEVRESLTTGISVAVAYPPEIICNIKDYPTHEYLDWYEGLNVKLDNIVTKGARHLQEMGYQAKGMSREYVNATSEGISTLLPHKTIATIAGMGWIGKSALLVTKEYGSAIRISSILTNAPLPVAQSIGKSLCGSCTECVKDCPGEAIIGENWNVGKPLAEYYDARKCFEKAKELSKLYLGKDITVCGKCIEVCPYTKGYLNER